MTRYFEVNPWQFRMEPAEMGNYKLTITEINGNVPPKILLLSKAEVFETIADHAEITNKIYKGVR